MRQVRGRGDTGSRAQSSGDLSRRALAQLLTVTMGCNLSMWISLVTLITTVIYYYKMVVLTELTTEATLFNTLYAEYATPHMLDSVRSVAFAILVSPSHLLTPRALIVRAVEDFAHETKLEDKQIICRKSTEKLWDRKLDHDWQRILHWYQKVVYFHRMGLLNDRFYKEFPGESRTRHFVEHVEPFALNSCRLHEEKNCSDIFDYLRKLYSLPARQQVTCGDEKDAAGKAAKEEL
ncbi:TPA: hypothetical protein N0F65_009947 [Lagenidium giganteum]|uniref:Uncharacterized protein n=1 Tax=Lagenidium giganteum TaxID=4803 RepID=A0AAV2YVM8_9STRA|nr:TPA: hypothetical protein N0F65_009947 [Lagenidium giganteum]